MDMDALIAEITVDEGIKNYAYQDNLGFWTIGSGRLIDAKKGGGISDDERIILLKNDIQKHTDALFKALPWTIGLSDNRKKALINMCFQMGIGGLLEFKKMLAALRAENYTQMETEALNSTWAKETPDRAKRVIAQLKNG